MVNPECSNQDKIRSVTSHAKWMSCPKTNNGNPGLAYLEPLDELYLVRQTDRLHDVIGAKGTGYTIFNNQGEKVFLVVQEQLKQTYYIRIFNLYGNEVIQVRSELSSSANRAVVSIPPGNEVCSVTQQNVDCACTNEVFDTKTYLVRNNEGNVFIKIKESSTSPMIFRIKMNRSIVGFVKESPGLPGKICVRHVGISFPVTMSTENKAILIGACFCVGCLNYTSLKEF